MRSQKFINPGSIGLVVLLLFAWLSLMIDGRPSPRGADAAATDFSSARAMKHLGIIAAEPHAVGSAANKKVQKYLEESLASMGLEVETQTKMMVTASRSFANTSSLVPVTNVMGRLKGATSKETLLVAAHYDSVPNAPGAGDDGAAVAAMLETLSCIKAGDPIQNDIIFLFTDGEEIGLLGAQLFVEEHPWASEVDFTINFEGRGNSGPSLMFETSQNNDWVVREYLKAAPNPVAHSFSYEVYKRMPTDTDFTRFKDIPDVVGLNFAYLGGANNYHSGNDTPAHLNQATLQHHGSNMLSVIRHFGNLSMNRESTKNVIYFYVPLLGSVVYSSGLVFPLLLLATLLLVGVLVIGFRKKKLTVGGLLGSLPLNLVVLVLTILISIVAWKAFSIMGRPEMHDNPSHPYRSGGYLVGLLLLCSAFFMAVISLICRKLRVENQSAGSLILWLALAWLMGISFPGASYIFIWPTLFAGIGFLLILLKPDMGVPKQALTLFLTGVPGMMVVLAILPLVFLAMPMGFQPIAPAVVGLFVGLLAMMLAAPFMWALPSPKWAPAGLAIVGILVLATITKQNRVSDADHPSIQSLLYVADSDGVRNHWLSMGPLKSWNSGFYKQGDDSKVVSPFSNPGLAATAGPTQTPRPLIKLIGETAGKRYKTLDLHLSYPTPGVDMVLQLKGGPVRKLIVGGSNMPVGTTRFTVLGVSSEGLVAQMKVPRFKDFSVHAYAILPGLPADVPHEPIPDGVIPPQNRANIQHKTLVGEVLLIPASEKVEEQNESN